MKYREIIRQIKQDGWYLKRTSGSHHVYKHPTKPEQSLWPIMVPGTYLMGR